MGVVCAGQGLVRLTAGMRFLTNAELIIDLIPNAEIAGKLAQSALMRDLVVTSLLTTSSGIQMTVRTRPGTAAPDGTAWAEPAMEAFAGLIATAKAKKASEV